MPRKRLRSAGNSEGIPQALRATAGLHLCCVSAAQRATLPAHLRDAAHLIENGVALDALRPRAVRRGFALALARICPEKGLHDALDAASEAGVALLIGGEVSRWEAHRRYFDEEIAPRLRAPHRFLGAVDLARKGRLLSAARCLLVPSRAPETSSLVAMEALACGTPVVAYPSGALASVVAHGRTGLLVDDARGMAAPIARAPALSAAACRLEAERRFSGARMAGEYLELYARLARTGRPPRARASALLVSEVRGEAGLAAVAGAWGELYERCPWATPFQRPEWLLTYARAFCAEDAAWALLLHRGDELVGLAPLCTRGTTVGLLGQGVSDYLDLLALPEIAERAAERVLAHLASTPVHAIALDGLRAGSPLLAARCPSGRADRQRRIEPCPVLPLGAADGVPRPMQDKLRYYGRRAARDRAASIEANAPGEAAALVERLFALHGARWAARGETGVLADERVRDFHRDAVPALARTGRARLHALAVADALAAVALVLTDRERAYYYLGGFDPAFGHLSPGTLVVGQVIERARQAGAVELDFLRGAEHYKYRFGARDRWLHERRLTEP